MRTRTKICGITRIQDINSVVHAGADAIGLVFYPPSPRHVNIEQAQGLLQDIPAYVQVVGLFVNATADEIAAVLKQVPLDILQFHGDETPLQCQQIAEQVGRRWYKAIQVKPDLNVLHAIKSYQQAGASAVLLDAWHPEEAIHTTQAYAVDVSGGVESAKGIKDQQLIENFMQGVQRGSAKYKSQ